LKASLALSWQGQSIALAPSTHVIITPGATHSLPSRYIPHDAASASVIALPVGGYLGVALISRIDTLVDNQQKAAIIVARFEDKFASLESAIADATADRYRAADAARDLRLRDQKDAEQDRVNQQQDKRLDDHDARLNALSTELRKF